MNDTQRKFERRRNVLPATIIKGLKDRDAMIQHKKIAVRNGGVILAEYRYYDYLGWKRR